MSRTRQLRTLCGAVVASLAVAAPSSAAPFTPALERAQTTAERYWGGGPVDCTSLDRQIVPDGSLGEGVEGRATVPVEPQPCILYVVRSLARPNMFVRACGVLAHELGHLRGLGHSDDPADVMYAYTNAPPAICFRAGIRELNRRALALKQAHRRGALRPPRPRATPRPRR